MKLIRNKMRAGTFIVLLTSLLIASCSGGSAPDTTVNEPANDPPITESNSPVATPTNPPPVAAPTNPSPDVAPDSDPDVVSKVAYSDVLALPYEAAQTRLSYGQDSLQFTEFWPGTPRDNLEDLPAVVLLHGGCWSNIYRIDQTYPMASALAQNGFNVWSVEYRATGDTGGGWPGTAEDVTAAISNILRVASDYYSERRHVIVGHSAGGHLALLAHSLIEAQQAPQLNYIGLAAITDIGTYAQGGSACARLAASFMNGTPETLPDAYLQATPAFDALTDIAILFIGDSDAIIPLAQSESSGLPVTLVEDTGHFDWIHPRTNAFSRFMMTLTDLQFVTGMEIQNH